MNPISLSLRAPMSTILKKSGFNGVGYQIPYQNEHEVFLGKTNFRMPMQTFNENSQLNNEINKFSKPVSAPSMSTPLNAFQTNNPIWQAEKLNVGKSTTNSLNAPLIPQRFSSYSQMPYSTANVSFQPEFGYNSFNGNQNMGVKPNNYNAGKPNIFQNKIPYMQPQILTSQLHFQNSLQYQNQQSSAGTNHERYVGFFNRNRFINGTSNSSENFRGVSVGPQNRQHLFESTIRMNTYNGNLQPQISQSLNNGNNNLFIANKNRYYQDQNLSTGDIEQSYNENCVPKYQQIPITAGTTIKGYKPTVVVENQDKSLIIELSPYLSAYAVFDGHGPHGDVVADFVSSKFASSITQLLASLNNNLESNEMPTRRQRIKNFFIVLFHNIDLQLSELKYGISLWSGCTAAVCIKIYDEVHIAWVGDSRVVIFKFSRPSDYMENTDQTSEVSQGATVSWWTTSDHIPNRPDELSRITDCGASIAVYPTPWLNKSTVRIREHGIAMSRSFGDKAGAQFGVICKPDMASIKLTSNENPENFVHQWAIVVASDGIWDSLSEEEVGYKIMKDLLWKDKETSGIDEKGSKPECLTKEEVSNLTNNIAIEAWKFRASVENYSDDTTLIISIL